MERQDPQAALVDVVDLAESAAHELNNSLNNILLHLALVDKQDLLPETRAETEAIRQLGMQAAFLLKQWQQFAESHQPALEAVDINRIVREAIHSWGGSPSDENLVATVGGDNAAPGRGVTLHLNLAENLPPTLAIPSDLRRLVMHLLDSCVAALALRPGSIDVFTELGHRQVLLRIEDSGPAVAHDQLPFLFRPFALIRPGDNGVGLAICKLIVGRLQGSLQASIRPGGGISFKVELRPASD